MIFDRDMDVHHRYLSAIIIHQEAMTFERWCQVFGRTTANGLPAFP